MVDQGPGAPLTSSNVYYSMYYDVRGGVIMATSVRLDRETEQFLEKTAKSLGKTKSEIIKMSIRDFCAKKLAETKSRPYDLLKDLVGSEGSGRGDLSARGEEILRERLGRKR